MSEIKRKIKHSLNEKQLVNSKIINILTYIL